MGVRPPLPAPHRQTNRKKEGGWFRPQTHLYCYQLALHRPSLLAFAQLFHVADGQRLAALIELGADLYVLAIVSAESVGIADIPGLLVFIIYEDGLAILVLHPAGQVQCLALRGRLLSFQPW